ncbi:MAG: LysR family transcriptional regulator [Wujia sp.]
MYDNLNNYKVFYTVARTGNISKAADILFISQPAISKSISKLEEGLHVKLFDRTSKGVKLTEEGNILYEHIKSAFDSINQGEDEIKRMNELGIGQLRIGVSTSLCKHILLDYLQDFIVANPHIKVIIDCHSTVNTMKLLQEGKIDIGLICETAIPKGFVYQELTEIHDTFVASEAYLDNLHVREQEDQPAPSDNPWLFAGDLTSLLPEGSAAGAEHPDNILSIKDTLEKSNLMLLEKNNITRTHIDNYLEKENIHPNQILEINNLDLLLDFASIGMGISSVVREFAMDYITSGQVVELKLDKEIPKRTVGFVYPDTKNKPTVLNKFLSFCEI